ncbi:MAG TPA: 1,4-dihydroxy-2-naphthoate octaprenyltransferase [Candidatus Hydrogenedentes bacterium]|nr:1,4-dihydroxy-2-naphthoate octaprenyltransferase [Candidatus Hydrogenedentota bacterium]
MISAKRYLIYARAPFAPASVVPVLLGAALAWRFAHEFNAINFALTLAGMVFAHFGINLFNDYHDFLQGADQNNRFRNPFSGGSPHLVGKRERPETIRNLARLSAGVALACGVALIIRVDRGLGPILCLMIVGFAGGYFYTAPPLRFVYRGLGEAFIILNFGLLPVFGTYYVMTRSLSWTPLLGSLPVGLLITNVLYINQFPDYESDHDSGKRTLVVRLGTHRARFVYVCIAFLALALIAIPALWMGFPRLSLLGLLGLMPTVPAAWILIQHHAAPQKLLKAQALTITAHIATGVLLSASFLWPG